MTLNQLKYFCTASRCHSITKAAQELYVTQPTISTSIRELEIEFGISLFHRDGNRLNLTEEGAKLYKKATYILQYCNELQTEYSSIARVKPPMRIGIPPILSAVFFPELLRAFQAEYPGIPVTLEEYGSVRACDLVQNDTLDLALVNMELYNIDKFNHHVLAKEQLLFCVDEKHPLAEEEVVNIETISKMPLILFNKDSVQNQLIHMRFEFAGFTPNVIMRSSQIYTTLQFLKEQSCGCFLFSDMVKRLADNRITNFVGIPLDPPIRVDVGMVWKKGKYISNDMQKFLTFTRKYYEEHKLV